MEIFIKEKGYKTDEWWYSTAIDHYRNEFALNNSIEEYHPLVDNLDYRFQNLELLEKEISKLNLSNTIIMIL